MIGWFQPRNGRHAHGAPRPLAATISVLMAVAALGAGASPAQANNRVCRVTGNVTGDVWAWSTDTGEIRFWGYEWGLCAESREYLFPPQPRAVGAWFSVGGVVAPWYVADQSPCKGSVPAEALRVSIGFDDMDPNYGFEQWAIDDLATRTGAHVVIKDARLGVGEMAATIGGLCPIDEPHPVFIDGTFYTRNN